MNGGAATAGWRKGDRIEVVIHDTAEDDACVGRLPDGMVVFVRGLVAPGDRVAAAVTKIKSHFLEARLVEVLDPSPDRVAPRCAHFGICGGCKWQHLDYARQLAAKGKVVADALQRLGGFTGVPVHAPLGAPDPYHYRNKVEFTFCNERFLLEEELPLDEAERDKPSDFALGYHRRGCFHKVIDIDACHIATETTSRVLAATRGYFLAHRRPAYSTITHTGLLRNLVVRHAGFTGELMVNLVTSEHEPALMAGWLDALRAEAGDALTTVVNSTTRRKNLVAYGEVHHVLHGPGVIVEELDGLRFTISPNSFFQTNSRQALRLYQVIDGLAGVGAEEVLFDLYCGTGSITQFVGRRCRAAVGFELEPSAITDARENARINGLDDRCSFVATDMKHLRAAMEGAGPRPDVVITDPPRAGMHVDAVEALRSLAPRRIVYVSCHPGSLARDAKALCADGRYRLEEVQPVDLFPHTFHIESVARLVRVG